MWTIALLVFLGLVALTVVVTLLVPLFMAKSYSIEKSITVNAPPEVCYDKVTDLNQYAAWNPWSQMEPDANKKIEGTPKTAGHSYKWEGKKIGEGKLTIKEVHPHTSAKIELEFFKPWKSVALDAWTFEASGNQTKITWKNGGPLAYPTARLLGPFIMKNLSQQFEQGLHNLKDLCEK